MDALRQDLRHAVRILARAPGFTAVAVATLALGIGAASVMYSVIRNVLLDPFPYRDSDRLVDVLVRDLARPDAIYRGPLPADEFLDYQEQSDAFEDVAGALGDSMILTSTEGARPATAVHVTPNTFGFLGVAPLLGRVLGPDDTRPDAPAVAVLSHTAWRDWFGGDPRAVGQTIVLDRQPRTVVGVMPPRFAWHVADVWVTDRIVRGARAADTARWFQAHLKPGVTLARAEAELNLIASRRARANPTEYPKQFRIQVLPVIDFVVGRYRRVLYTLFAAVGLLLLIACCNVASMLLARATVREGEMTIRAALGASRGRLARQLLVESLVLGLLAAAAGCLLAHAGLEALVRVMPRQNVAWETEIRLDRHVLLFSLAAAVASAVLSGLLPAWHGARRDLVSGLKHAGKGMASGFGRRGARHALVVTEVALSLVLLLGAGLLMRTFVALVQVDLGFDPRDIVIAPFAFPAGEYAAPFQKRQFVRQVLQRVAALPGVVVATESAGWPPPMSSLRSEVETAGRADANRERVIVRMVGQNFLRVFGITLVSGRGLSEEDIEGARRLAVVNQALAARYFADGNAIGRSITLTTLRTIPDPVADPIFEIVGVVRDVRNSGIREAPVPEVLVPSTTRQTGWKAVVARAAGNPLPALRAIQGEIRAVDPRVALAQGDVLENALRQSFYVQPRFSLIVLSAFALTGLALVALGVYGVLAYTVARRRQEIAVRMALGADRGRVLGSVLRLGGQLIAAGTVAGLALSAATTRLLENQLWGTSPYDPPTILSTVAVVAVVGLAACCVPAARAARVDPAAALRQE